MKCSKCMSQSSRIFRKKFENIEAMPKISRSNIKQFWILKKPE